MDIQVILGIVIPWVGTVLGAGCVFFMTHELRPMIQKGLLGFAGGVMIAASVWSLLIPAMEEAADMGRLAFVPAVAGFLAGIAFLLLLDHFIPHLHMYAKEAEGVSANLHKSTMLMLAVTLHNLPEGMAVGVLLAAALSGEQHMSMSAAMSLAIGIAIQNFPEGAIISMPIKEQVGKKKAFIYGALSGIVEPIGAVLTLLFVQKVSALLPYLLAFAAGAMVYVVVEELIPEASEGEHSNIGTVGFAIGFALMMVLDVALG
ncbi:MAG: ZIP family metal transporter [Lachnospiraceae bacterium]|nr:ZIP family metal transporter [Lachnospiraceae bacterium]MDY5741460.1 ZIP family metal transporter [Lachnospiraceae bacterium]